MSRNNDIRPHSHTKTGDGGEIPEIPTVVASGTTTVPANGNTTVNLDFPRESHLFVAAYPSDAFSGAIFAVTANSNLDIWLRYNATTGSDGWELRFGNNQGTDYDVTWRVYEL